MYKRLLINQLKFLSKKYPVVTLLGPRQSGKTTLVKKAFESKPYVNLEDGETRSLANTDPKSFLESYPNGAIFDEIQRTPQLLSYIQVIVDSQPDRKGLFILTGSHQALLRSQVSQSLAGRTTILKLLPLSLKELRLAKIDDPIESIILKGGYPRIYKEDLPISNAYSSYFQTYVERDVHKILQIKNIIQFERFIKLIVSRIGQIVNYSSLSIDVGVSANTIKEWVAVLEATYILARLEPYFENFGKRQIKSPKIYFTDTGLACYLLGIEDTNQLKQDPLFGSLFENWIIMEMMKGRYNEALEPRFYFYRDVQGHEVDLLIQRGSQLIPIEIKSSKTFSSKFLDGLHYFHKQTKKASGGFIIYNGSKSQKLEDFQLLSSEKCLKVIEDL